MSVVRKPNFDKIAQGATVLQPVKGGSRQRNTVSITKSNIDSSKSPLRKPDLNKIAQGATVL